MQKNDAPFSKALRITKSTLLHLFPFLLLMTLACSQIPQEEDKINLLKYTGKEWKITSANVKGTTYVFGIQQYLLDNVGYIPYFIIKDKNTLIKKDEYRNQTITTSYKIINFTSDTIKTEFRTNISTEEYYEGVQVIRYSFTDYMAIEWTINSFIIYATNNINKKAVEVYYVNGTSDVKKITLSLR